MPQPPAAKPPESTPAAGETSAPAASSSKPAPAAAASAKPSSIAKPAAVPTPTAEPEAEAKPSPLLGNRRAVAAAPVEPAERPAPAPGAPPYRDDLPGNTRAGGKSARSS